MISTQRVPKQLLLAILDAHADHGADRVAEGEAGEEEVRLGEFTSEDKEPEQERREARLRRELGVARGERLRGEVLARLASNAVAEHAPGGHDREQERRDDRDEELHDAKDERELTTAGFRVFCDRDVEGRAGGESERDKEEEQPPREMRGVVPGRGDVREFGEGSSYHDHSGHSTPESGR